MTYMILCVSGPCRWRVVWTTEAHDLSIEGPDRFGVRTVDLHSRNVTQLRARVGASTRQALVLVKMAWLTAQEKYIRP